MCISLLGLIFVSHFSHLLGGDASGGEKKSSTCALACLVTPGVAWTRARVHDICVNGPPKSDPSPYGGVASFWHFVFWLIGL